MNDQEESSPEISEYKGKPMLTLNPGAKYPFSFGLGKAKLVIEHLDTIKRFVETEGDSIN